MRAAVEALETRIEAARLAAENREAAVQSLTLAEERFKAGAGSTLEVRDAQLKLTQAELALLENRIDVEIARFALMPGHGHAEPGRVEMKWWKAVIAGVLFLGAAAITVGGLKERPPPTVEVQVAKARKGTITRTITGAGKVQAATTVKISSNLSGDLDGAAGEGRRPGDQGPGARAASTGAASRPP